MNSASQSLGPQPNAARPEDTQHEDTQHEDTQPLDEACPIALSLEMLGQKWTLLIIREAVRGATKFTEFQEALGCPKNLLSARLRLLRDHGILQCTPYEVPGQRTRELYELTPAGRDLAPALIALYDWGRTHTAPGGSPWVEPSRCCCGARVHTAVVCEEGHTMETVDAIVFPPRLGAAPRP